MLSKDREITVAIVGNRGSGKSTLAAALGSNYDCNIFHMDDFFLQPEERTEDRMKAEHVMVFLKSSTASFMYSDKGKSCELTT